MAILTAKQTWKRPPSLTGHKTQRELVQLTPTEEQRVRRAMRVLHVRYGNWTQVGRALGYHRVTLERVVNIRKRASLAFAMRVAKKLEVTLGDLQRAWPKAGSVRCVGRARRRPLRALPNGTYPRLRDDLPQLVPHPDRLACEANRGAFQSKAITVSLL
jgi:hypothetical protein